MKQEIHHSEEFRHIISKFPTKFNTILAVALFTILSILILLGWFIQSPEIVLADVKVTAEKPPISLVAESNGKLKIMDFMPQKQIEEGKYLAIIENLGNHKNINQLNDSLIKYKSEISAIKFSSFDFALNYNLGDVQHSYFEFINTLYELENNNDKNEYDIQISLLNNQTSNYEELINQRNKLKKFKTEEIQILNKRVSEDSLLYSKGMLVKPDYDNGIINLLKEKENLTTYDLENIRNNLNISESKSNANLRELQKDLKSSSIKIKLLNAYQKLILSINDWEKKYVIKSPVKGQVDYLNFISSNQFVNQGEVLFSILPNDNKIIGQVLMPSDGAGKVKIGQEVFIKLHAFPYQEFGKLSGRVKSISLIPTESLYLVIVELPKGLISDSGMVLSFGRNMEGEAEIVTEKRKLISKIFDKISKAFDRKKNKTVESDNTEKNDTPPK